MRRLLALLLLGLACVLLVACGDDGGGEEEPASTQGASPVEDDLSGAIVRNRNNARVSLTVGSKNFTEQKVLGELYAQGLEAAGYRVERQLDLGDEQAAQQALRADRIDGYPEYTGTALLSLCDRPTSEIPKDPQQAWEDARLCLADRGQTAFAPTPFNSANEVGVKNTTARRFGLKTISDLREVAGQFTLYGSPECRRRADCLPGLEEVYGLRFKEFRVVDVDRRHEPLRRGGPIASIVFTTDPQILREGIVLLEDDRGMFPPYNSTFLVRDEVADAAGRDLSRTIQQIELGLTDETMQELNARVDLDRQTPEIVAREYLRESGLVVPK